LTLDNGGAVYGIVFNKGEFPMLKKPLRYITAGLTCLGILLALGGAAEENNELLTAGFSLAIMCGILFGLMCVSKIV
jgi:hypothetical protein